MNDEEIKKALECCADKDGASCKHCPYNSDCSKGGIRMLTDSLALINRQQADIEKFKNAIKEADRLFSEGSFYCGLAVVARLAIEIERGGENV